LPDPLLTPLGEKQCQQLQHKFPYHHNVKLLVSSPIRRTIYTTLLAFEPEVKKGCTVIALPELQETSDLPCDTGSDPSVVQKGKWAPTPDAIQARAKYARQWLRARPEKDIVIVTHGGFLHYFTEDWTGSDKYEGKLSLITLQDKEETPLKRE